MSDEQEQGFFTRDDWTDLPVFPFGLVVKNRHKNYKAW